LIVIILHTFFSFNFFLAFCILLLFRKSFQTSPSWQFWNWINRNGRTWWLEFYVPPSTEACSPLLLLFSLKSLLYVVQENDILIIIINNIETFLLIHLWTTFSFFPLSIGVCWDRSECYKAEDWTLLSAVCCHWGSVLFHSVLTGLFCYIYIWIHTMNFNKPSH